jgi:hypothetical protein
MAATLEGILGAHKKADLEIKSVPSKELIKFQEPPQAKELLLYKVTLDNEAKETSKWYQRKNLSTISGHQKCYI